MSAYKQLLEYSVVYSDRSLNHMSDTYITVMRDLSTMLKQVYQAAAVALVPGGGTFAMEAVARQIAKNERCMIVRNGWFSYRWSQILERCQYNQPPVVHMARVCDDTQQPQYAPPYLRISYRKPTRSTRDAP